jgi:DNA-binding NarL/FixJ family response regulator
MTLHIVVIDDHSIVREGLRLFLARDLELEIVGEAADGVKR